jgi:hypothetical protein
VSRARKLDFLALAVFGGIVGVVACSGTSGSDTVVPITGVTVRAETLTDGRGCGREATQVFKYAAVVLGKNPSGGAFDTLVAGNVFDCFSDGQFVELPASGGSFEYSIQIYAYNEAAFVAAGEAQVRDAVRNPTNLPRTNPTFTTTCSAVQLELVQSLAVCQPLVVGVSGVGAQPAPATVVLGATTFPGPEGGVVTCETDYTSVRFRSIVGGVTSEITEARCATLSPGLQPYTITISPAAAPASYVIEVALLRGDGTVLGQTTCGAETSPGLTSTAVCKPLP